MNVDASSSTWFRQGNRAHMTPVVLLEVLLPSRAECLLWIRSTKHAETKIADLIDNLERNHGGVPSKRHELGSCHNSRGRCRF